MLEQFEVQCLNRGHFIMGIAGAGNQTTKFSGGKQLRDHVLIAALVTPTGQSGRLHIDGWN